MVHGGAEAAYEGMVKVELLNYLVSDGAREQVVMRAVLAADQEDLGLRTLGHLKYHGVVRDYAHAAPEQLLGQGQQAGAVVQIDALSVRYEAAA